MSFKLQFNDEYRKSVQKEVDILKEIRDMKELTADKSYYISDDDTAIKYMMICALRDIRDALQSIDRKLEIKSASSAGEERMK